MDSITLTDLLTRFHVESRCTRIPMRTDRTQTDWDKTATHWHITLTSYTAYPDGSYLHPALGTIAVEYSQGSAHTKPPTVRDMLASLIRDAGDSTYTLDEFFAEFGFKTPSEAMRALNGCVEAGYKLKTLFGRDFDPASVDTEGD